MNDSRAFLVGLCGYDVVYGIYLNGDKTRCLVALYAPGDTLVYFDVANIGEDSYYMGFANIAWGHHEHCMISFVFNPEEAVSVLPVNVRWRAMPAHKYNIHELAKAIGNNIEHAHTKCTAYHGKPYGTLVGKKSKRWVAWGS